MHSGGRVGGGGGSEGTGGVGGAAAGSGSGSGAAGSSGTACRAEVDCTYVVPPSFVFDRWRRMRRNQRRSRMTSTTPAPAAMRPHGGEEPDDEDAAGSCVGFADVKTCLTSVLVTVSGGWAVKRFAPTPLAVAFSTTDAV